MSKRYLVKEISTATAENPNFAGRVVTSYRGKGDYNVALIAKYVERNDTLKDWMVKEYGYTRKCDAMRNWTYNNPENTKWWRSTVEIVEFDV